MIKNLSKIGPECISTSCSPRHIQSVIEDLLDVIKKQKELANEVLMLNDNWLEIGAGKMANLRELAKDIVWD
jgi:hypothetical protein